MFADTVSRLFSTVDVVIGRDIIVRDARFYRRFLWAGSLELGEAYMEQRIEIPHVEVTVARLGELTNPRNYRAMVSNLGWRLLLLVVLIIRHFISEGWARICNLQSIVRSQRVAQVHYNLPAILFEKMLGPTMQYSCAYYRTNTDDSLPITLDGAQRDKIQLIIDRLKLAPNMAVLDIGCGFGYLAAEIARRDPSLSVVGITIAREQYDWACEQYAMISNLQFRLLDYRRVTGKYDRIVSVEMYEQVGPHNQQVFMDQVAQLLTVGGLALLQVICNRRTRAATDPWMDRYIFPEGRLPSVNELVTVSQRAGLTLELIHNFGLDYSMTLRDWQINFIEAWPHLIKCNPELFSPTFYRRWNYYLSLCAGVFSATNSHLNHVVFSKQAVVSYRP